MMCITDAIDTIGITVIMDTTGTMVTTVMVTACTSHSVGSAVAALEKIATI
jgi:hypothetical protein